MHPNHYLQIPRPHELFAVNVGYESFPSATKFSNRSDPPSWHNKPNGISGNDVNPKTATFNFGSLYKSATQVGLAGSNFALASFRLSTPRNYRSLATSIARRLLILGALQKSNTKFSKTGAVFLSKSADYENSDPTEKSFTSNLLGMTLAHLTCTSTLPFTHLIHMDSVYRSNGIPLKGKRPDLLAISTKSPTLAATVEAKGTHGPWNRNQAEAAKRQAKALPKLGRMQYRYSIGSASYFEGNKIWSSYLVDPPSDESPNPDNSLKQISLETLLLSYYQPFINLAKLTHGGDPNYRRTVHIPIFGLPGVQLALPTELTSAFRESQEMQRPGQYNESTALQDLLAGTVDDLIDVVQNTDLM